MTLAQFKIADEALHASAIEAINAIGFDKPFRESRPIPLDIVTEAHEQAMHQGHGKPEGERFDAEIATLEQYATKQHGKKYFCGEQGAAWLPTSGLTVAK